MGAKTGRPEAIYLHAEVDALVKLKDWDRAHRIVVTRIGRNGDTLLAKPCPACQHAIKLAGIKHVEHT